MKKLLAIVVLGLFWNTTVLAKTFNYTCLKSSTKDFQIVYEINHLRQTIKHLTSYNFNTKAKYNVFENLKVVNLNKESATFVSTIGDNSTLVFLNFKTGRAHSSGILPGNPKESIYQSFDFECFVSNN